MAVDLPNVEHLADLYLRAVKAGDEQNRGAAKDAAHAVALSHSEAAFARTMATFLVASEGAGAST